MKGQSQNPQVNSRRERALAQRRRELDAWKDPESDLYRQEVERLAEEGETDVETHVLGKIEAAGRDIANLEAKGVR